MIGGGLQSRIQISNWKSRVWEKCENYLGKRFPQNKALEYKTKGIINPSGIEVEETRGSWILYEVNEEETIEFIIPTWIQVDIFLLDL